MNKIEIAKGVVNFAVGVGTRRIVYGMIKNNVVAENPTDTVAVATGSFVIAALVADVSKKYTDAKVDELVAWWKENVAKH